MTVHSLLSGIQNLRRSCDLARLRNRRPARSRRRLWPSLAILVLTLALSACVTGGAPLPPEPSETPQPPTETPTPTIVWFPPTATFTPPPLQMDATPTVPQSPEYGELEWSDDFTNPERWALARTASTSAALGKSELTLALSQPDGYLYSLRQGAELSDFYLEITASPSLCRNGDEYGLLLRVSPDMEFYRFSLTCEGQLRLDRYFGGRASSPQPLTYSAQVPRGAPGQSRLGVWAQGKEMRFYIDDVFQFAVRDPSLLSGGLGVFTRSNGENAVTVSFSDLKVYRLSED